MKYHPPTRRMFMMGAGGAFMTIPFLPSLSRKALAQERPSPKYVLISSNYAPDQTAAYPFPPSHEPVAPVTRLDAVTTRQSLSEISARQGYMTPALRGSAWDALQPHMNIIHGAAISGTNDKHNSTSTTAASMPHDVEDNGHPANDNPKFKYSADYLAERLLARPTHVRGALRMNLAFRHGSEYGWINPEYPHFGFGGPSAENPGYAEKLATMRDVAELEARLGSIGPIDAQDPDLDRRRKLIDAVKGDYDRLLAHPRLGRNDRTRLQRAVDLWNDAETRLRQGPTVQCEPRGSLTASNPRASWAEYHDYALSLCAHALACDVTPVINYTLLHTSDEAPDNGDEAFLAHGDSHGDVNGTIAAAFPWRAARIAGFGRQLLDLTDVSGAPLIESTLVLWSHEYAATGNHVNAGHWNLTLGAAGGRLQTGSFLNVAGEPSGGPNYRTHPNCVPYNRLLLTTLMAVGHTPASIEAITGDVGFGEYGDVCLGSNDHRSGASAGWSAANRNQYYSDAEKRKPLPILS